MTPRALLKRTAAELVYAAAMPGLLLLSYAGDRWPALVGRWDDFCDEVAAVRQARRR